MKPIVVVVISILLSACATTQSESLVSNDSRTGTYRQLKQKQGAHNQSLYYPAGFYSHDEQARYRTAKAWWNQ